MITNEKILCITMSDWSDHGACRHHLMRIMSEKDEIVWVEKVVYLNEIASKGLLRFFKFIKPVKRVKDNLYVITPPPAIPFLDKIPWVNRLNDWIFLRFIKKNLRKINFSPTILWLFSYYAYFTVGKFGEEVSLYYCNDHYPLWEIERNIRKEELLCQRVDFILTPDYKITEEKKGINANTYTIPHGVDTDIFNENNIYVPDEFKELKRPIIGYVGTIRPTLDVNLVEYIAQKRPDWSIVLVGPLVYLLASRQQKWEALAKYENIHLLGAKDIVSLPSYINYMDMAIMPYLVNEETDWIITPLKSFEYLIMGKPIVSTNFTDFKGIPDTYYEIGVDYDDFIQKIESCLKTDNEEKHKQRTEFARQNSWRHRIEQIESHLSAAKAKKASRF